ncbi:MAG: hypothetical protein AAGA30_18245, partial [Planctomycetota bacterium]
SNKARTPSKPAFENSKNRRTDLQDLIRGGTIPLSPNAPKKVEWPSITDRGLIMERLEVALREVLKPGISNQDEFKNKKDAIVQQANIVSALGQVLIQENMDEADDDGYSDFSKLMAKSARELIAAVEFDKFENASKAVNQIEQSCNDCHAEWR